MWGVYLPCAPRNISDSMPLRLTVCAFARGRPACARQGHCRSREQRTAKVDRHPGGEKAGRLAQIGEAGSQGRAPPGAAGCASHAGASRRSDIVDRRDELFPHRRPVAGHAVALQAMAVGADAVRCWPGAADSKPHGGPRAQGRQGESKGLHQRDRCEAEHPVRPWHRSPAESLGRESGRGDSGLR